MKINGIIRKDAGNIAKYSVVAVIVMIIYVFLLWLVIDTIGVQTFIGSAAIGISMFFLKYVSYITIKLIKHSFRNFIKYCKINAVSALLNIVLVWFFIDILGIPTIISSAVVVGGLFIVRFIMFKKVKLIE